MAGTVARRVPPSGGAVAPLATAGARIAAWEDAGWTNGWMADVAGREEAFQAALHRLTGSGLPSAADAFGHSDLVDPADGLALGDALGLADPVGRPDVLEPSDSVGPADAVGLRGGVSGPADRAGLRGGVGPADRAGLPGVVEAVGSLELPEPLGLPGSLEPSGAPEPPHRPGSVGAPAGAGPRELAAQLRAFGFVVWDTAPKEAP